MTTEAGDFQDKQEYCYLYGNIEPLLVVSTPGLAWLPQTHRPKDKNYTTYRYVFYTSYNSFDPQNN